jgi:hypothetical protein
MHTALQEREQTIMGDPSAASELIPQIVWAITCASREFYGTISTRTDVDPPEDEYGPGEPRFAQAELSIHTSMFKVGYKLNLANLPEQWKRTPPSTTQTSQQKTGRPNNTGNADQDRRHGSNPFRPTSGGDQDKPVAGTNPNQPSALQTADIKKIKETIQQLTLSDIAKEAGIRGGPSTLNTTGWPNNACLNWLCMGACMRRGCRLNHPTSVDDATATAVYKQLEPGVKRLLETKKRPGQN